MRKLLIFCLILASCSVEKKDKTATTFCNPLNLNYRFQNERNSFREAADPAMVRYKDKFILFVSHSGGYWISDDMHSWQYHPVKSLSIIEDYAPDAIVIGDTVFYTASAEVRKPFWYTTDPLGDDWKQMADTLPFSVWDPNFFLDDDGRRYLYWGCSNITPMYGVQLNGKMQAITEPKVFIEHNPDKYGWEVPGDSNELTRPGWNEGAWMTKYNNRYYLQYSAPGTEFKTYADGMYTSDNPLGPFTYETYSPFSYKPGGFAGSAGHSSTFQDNYGNYWHVSTMTISVRHMFERRLGIYPAAFDKDGVLRVFTAFGDYPTIIPNRKVDFENESLFNGWMLQSYNKKAVASSSIDSLPVTNAFDENIRTWWSAATGNPGEWLSVELDDKTTINAIQVNFADNGSALKAGSKDIYYQYKILASENGTDWNVIVDKSNNTVDIVHDYVVLEKPIQTKYIKVENVKVPDGQFSIYDLRIFGSREGNTPTAVNDFTVKRKQDTRRAKIEWNADNNATGFIVNYGTSPEKLYTQVMVIDNNSVDLTGLNVGVKYYISIDAFNESGITKGMKTVEME
ncbi:MAG TPA: family 43 glycosylhydrolase [Bacteroidales bacterium]|nr:family 43 glycosylhydrolase [Bacteroidales bacterium]